MYNKHLKAKVGTAKNPICSLSTCKHIQIETLVLTKYTNIKANL